MSEFSPSGIYGLPGITSQTLAGGDPRVLGWIQEAVQEGDRLNREDPSWDKADKAMDYIIGNQSGSDGTLPSYIPFAVVNQSRKSVQAHTSALTDIKPIFGYRATNPRYQFHGDLLNKIIIAWWIEAMADLALGDVIKYTLAGGTGDLTLEWNQGAAEGLGDHEIVAKDFRDTLPIRPGSHPSPQTWQGVVFRESHAINAMRAKFPQFGDLFQAAPDSLLTTIMGRFRKVVQRLQTPSDTLSGLAGMPVARPVRPGDVVLYRTYLNDFTKNMTAKPLVMGNPAANWSYIVQPGERLYPQKRLIVSTADLVVYDGPGVYWHGMYPFARLKLWSVPWVFNGLSILHDTIPIQDGINDTLKDLRLGIKQWTNPDVEFDKRATSNAFRQAMDPQRPGKKIQINSMGVNREPFKKHEGPNPQVLQQLFQLLEKLESTHENMTGTANLQQLMQLRQLPGADTIQKYFEALTPEIRQEGRMVEVFLRDLAKMFKFNIFQFENSYRRRNILGDAAQALEDFDYDPTLLIPALEKTTIDPQTGLPVENKDYVPQLDKDLSRGERARWFARLFTFTVTPNSILAMNATERKMMNFQLARSGYLDFWTLHESLETPNIGNPPPMPLPPLQPPDPLAVIADLQMQAQAMMGMPSGQQPKYTIGPAGEILEFRIPMTVTERLMAQQLMGIGMTENPSGRKASGQEAPQQETKKDEAGGQRTTVTESSK